MDELEQMTDPPSPTDSIPTLNEDNETTSKLDDIPLKIVKEQNGDHQTIDVVDLNKKGSLVNPFKHETRLLSARQSNLVDTLKTAAVEIYLEFFGMSRVELFGKTECLAALFNEGTQPGTWRFLEKGEPMPTGLHMRCFKKFRLPAATDVDRSESYLVCLFMAENIQKDELTLSHGDAWAYAKFTVAEVLECDEMIIDKRLNYTRTGAIAKGNVSFSLDLIYPIDSNNQHKRICIDFGFLEGCPRRNRMFFEMSKTLRCGKWTPFYKSEVRCFDDAAKYDLASIDAQNFHGGELTKMNRLELFRWYKNGKTKLLGFVQTNFEKLLALKQGDQLYWWPAEEGISTAKIIVKDVKSNDTEFNLMLRMSSMF